MDIKSFFDNIDHALLLKAVDKHVQEKWQCLYITRWLTTAVQHPNGRLEIREQGNFASPFTKGGLRGIFIFQLLKSPCPL